MIKNKRFYIGVSSFIVWIVAILFFHQDPVRLATGLTLIVTPYIAGETFRPSGTKSESTTDKTITSSKTTNLE